MCHTVKSQRDSYHDMKRSKAEKLIFQELRFIRNLGKESYRVARKNQVEVANMRKIIDAIQDVVGAEKVNEIIMQSGLEPVPEEPELIEEAQIEENTEKDELIDLSNESLIIDTDSAEEELIGDITNPDSSIEISKVVPLTEQQAIAKERRLQLEKEIETAGVSLLPDGPYSYKAYIDLQDEIQRGFSPVVIAAPSDPAKFKRRYGFDWTPDMTRHVDFGGSRAEGPRIQKPEGWKAKVKAEEAALAKEKASLDKKPTRSGAKKKPQPKPKSETQSGSEARPPKDKGKGKKSTLRFIQEDNPADNEPVVDDVFDDSEDDFDQPGPSTGRKRKLAPPKLASKEEPEPKKAKMASK